MAKSVLQVSDCDLQDLTSWASTGNWISQHEFDSSNSSSIDILGKHLTGYADADLQTWTCLASICIHDPCSTVKIYHGISFHLGHVLFIQNGRLSTSFCDRINRGSFSMYVHVAELNRSAISFSRTFISHVLCRELEPRTRTSSTSKEKLSFLRLNVGLHISLFARSHSWLDPKNQESKPSTV